MSQARGRFSCNEVSIDPCYFLQCKFNTLTHSTLTVDSVDLEKLHSVVLLTTAKNLQCIAQVKIIHIKNYIENDYFFIEFLVLKVEFETHA